MTNLTVLVVEDEPHILEAINYNLSRNEYRVVTATDGEQALLIARKENPDIVILDIMLPKLDGLEVCRLLRRETNVPILMLTAKYEEIDKIIGLEIGADDYMTKPFSMRELLARIKALIRRTHASNLPLIQSAIKKEPLHSEDLVIDPNIHQVLLNGLPLNLRPKEYDLLYFLVKHRTTAFTRDELLNHVWGYDYPGDTRTVDVHIHWLREKIETLPSKPGRIITIRGVGYRFVG